MANARLDIFAQARASLSKALGICIEKQFGVKPDEALLKRMDSACSRILKRGRGEIAFPCAMLCKVLKGNKPVDVAKKLKEELNTLVPNDEELKKVLASSQVEGPYLNVSLNTVFLGQIVTAILEKGHLEPLEKTKDRVMVEYSQPNSHKAFHVGHMRNAALGDCLVRLYEQMGHPVVAVNYFGDEGAHVAKCLWLLLKRLKKLGVSIEELDVPKDRKGEYLGLIYAEAVDMLDLGSLTEYPFLHVVTAKVCAPFFAFTECFVVSHNS